MIKIVFWLNYYNLKHNQTINLTVPLFELLILFISQLTKRPLSFYQVKQNKNNKKP